MTSIPSDFPVQPVDRNQATDPVTCGTCGLTWDDAIVTSMTPAPSARCPFEAFHAEERNTTPAQNIAAKTSAESLQDSSYKVATVSTDAICAAGRYVSREWGDYGYQLGIVYGNRSHGVFAARCSDGSEFFFVADKWGNVADIT